jgi:hypothetical protein
MGIGLPGSGATRMPEHAMCLLIHGWNIPPSRQSSGAYGIWQIHP